MIALVRPSAERMRRRSVSRLSCGSRPVLTSNCVVVASGVAGLRDLHSHRIVQELLGDAPDFRRHGGGEEQGLARERHQLADALDVGNEAHVEHAVGLVDHQQLDAGEQQPSALEMVEQPTGRRDEDVDAAGELGILVVERHPADHQRDVELLPGAVLFEAFLHLGGEFARRLEDERARHSGAGAAVLEHGQHRQREGRGLAGAGLRDAEHVAPREHVRYGLFLNGRGGGVAGRLYRGENFFGQAELRKGHKTSSWDRPEPSRAG